jgi:tetratricopeptide (TPR) repeat protein
MRALDLAKSLERHDALAPIFSGLYQNVLTQGQVAKALTWAQEMLDLAKATGDPDLLIAGHMHACNGHSWAGEFAKALEHTDKVLELYDDKQHRHLADLFTSLDWARRQQAKSWELRTSTSLARLSQSQGKCQEADELLAPVYGWFTEGFDTRDLLDAKVLLGEIAMN